MGRPNYRPVILRMSGGEAAARPAPAPKPKRPGKAASGNLIRLCLYGSSCGCATRKCYAFVTADLPLKTVRMAAECADCMRSTVLAGPSGGTGPPGSAGGTSASGSPWDWWGWGTTSGT